ncbi:MAG: DUF2971 domain-containing protein [Syntrophorhabdales bacterium]
MNSKDESIIYHYTDDKGALGIIESQSLWATHHRYLNDPNELSIFRDVLNQWRRSQKRISKSAWEWVEFLLGIYLSGQELDPESASLYDAYIVSFCNDDGDRLSQWRAYGKGGGYAIGFGRVELDQMLQQEEKNRTINEYFLTDVSYGKRDSIPNDLEPKMKQCMDSFRRVFRKPRGLSRRSVGEDREDGSRLLQECLCRFKDEGYREEKEVRALSFVSNPVHRFSKGLASTSPRPKIYFRMVNNVQMPYIKLFEAKPLPLPIKKVVIGPCPDIELKRQSMRMVLAMNGIDPEIIALSSIPYRGR